MSQALVDAAIATLTAEFNGTPAAFAVGDIPGTDGRSSEHLPTRWIEVGVTRSFGGAYRSAGGSSSSYYYLTFGVADANAPSVLRWQERIQARMESARLAVGSKLSTELRYYDQDPMSGPTYLGPLSRHWLLTTYSLAL